MRRDAAGIPHLWAPDVLELARLQGREAVRDRAWQMEHRRWRMEGRTAEFLGAAGVPWDTFARQVLLEPTVRDCYEALGDETREWVDAYVSGVNDGLAESLSQADEVRTLRIEEYAAAPRPWAPWTPLGIFWSIHLLFGTFPYKLFNAQVADRLGPQWLPFFATEGGEGSGSNAWVVGGHRTVSGMPLLAGDPHRTIEVPGCYQQVGLACLEFDIVGFTFPGVPGVQHFGHAGEVAWGITNAAADYQDLTVEHLRLDGDRVSARGVDGWEPADRSTETITVRGSDSVEVPVVVTRRGPIITGVAGELDRAASEGDSRGPDGFASAGPAAYSLRTPTRDRLDLGFHALLPLLRSRTVDDVVTALAGWVEPVNSALVADTRGHMRHVVTGRVPQRHADNMDLPIPAWDPRHEWTGWASAPVTEVTDVMVSANDRASGGGLGNDYATPFRANRIRELIGDRVGLTADDCAAIHMDTRNGQADLMRHLVADLDDDALSAGARHVCEALLRWDGHSDADSEGAAVFAAWRHALVGWLRDHEALTPLRPPSGHSSVFAAWLDLTVQIGYTWLSAARSAGRLGIDIAAGAAVALEAVARQGVSGAVWSDGHHFDPVHALDLIGLAPVVKAPPLSGDKGCVLAAGSTPGVADACYVGPVARYVWDLSDRAASRWVVPLGAGGRVGSRHYDDQLDLWVTGGLLPVGPGSSDGAGHTSLSAGAQGDDDTRDDD